MTTTNFAEKQAQLDQKARQQQLAALQQQEEQARKNPDFVQYSRKSMQDLSFLQLKSGLAGAIFTYISMKMGYDNKLLISQETLAEIFDVNRVSVSKAIKLLIDSKFLTVLKSGNSNIYCLNANVVWTTDNNMREFAEFRTAVVISKKEQQPKKTQVKRIKQVVLKEKKPAGD